MKTVINIWGLTTICVFSLGLLGCNGGGGNSSSSAPTLQVSQNIPNLYLNQDWRFTVHADRKLTESIVVTLQSNYGVSVSPSTIILSAESPVASVVVNSGDIICPSCYVVAAAENYANGYSNKFKIVSGQLPDYGGVSDLETSSGSSRVYAASTAGHVYYAKIDTATESSTIWTQVSTKIPEDGAINDMDYDRLTKNVYVSTSLGNSYISLGGVGAWESIGGGSLPNQSISYGTQIDELGNLFAASNDGSIYVTSIKGSWQQLGAASLPDGGIVTSENGIHLTPANGGIESVFVGTSKGNVYVTNVNSSSLVSSSWVRVANSAIPASEEISAINVDSTANPPFSGNIYVGTKLGSIYSSAGVNGSWSKLGQNLGGTTNLIEIESTTNDVYTLTQYGPATFSAYYSPAQSLGSWADFGNILPDSMSDGCTVGEVVTSFPGKTLQFAGTVCGDVYFSINGFQNWKPVGMP
jgi:hypothetical protein